MRRARLTSLYWVLALTALFVASTGCSAGGGDDDNNPQAYSISGKVALNGAGINGVTVSLSGGSSSSVTTDGTGDYRFSGLSNGTYTITPSLTGHTFNPGSISVTVSGGNRSNNDFSAIPTTFSLSGWVTQSGAGLSGATVSLTGSSSATTSTDAYGNYFFQGLPPGSYTVTPTLSGYTFEPEFSTISITNSNKEHNDFTAMPIPTYSISGRISEELMGVSGVTITLSGDSLGTASTDNTGYYEFTGLSNSTYLMTPSRPGYFFDPESLSVTVENENRYNQDFSSGSVKIPSPEIKVVQGMIILPQDFPLEVSTLRVRSVFGSTPIYADGAFYDLPVLNDSVGQLEFVVDSSDNPVMVAYVSAQHVISGNLTIGAEEMALGLAAFNPYLMVLSPDQRAEILDIVRYHSDFSSLVTAVSAALIQSPQNALDYETNPHIFQNAIGIGLKVLDSFSGGNVALNDAALGSIWTAPVGLSENPHLDDPAGPYITFINPKMTFYGVDINPATDLNEDRVLLKKKASLIKYGFPLGSLAPATELRFWLGNGNYTLTFFKGFNFSDSGWLNIDEAAGKATWANFLHGVSIILDLVGAFVVHPPDIGPLKFFKLSDDLIYYVLTAPHPDGLTLGEDIELAIKSTNWLKVIRAFVGNLKDNWPKYAQWIWQEWPGIETTNFMNNAFKVVEGVVKAFTPIKYIVLGAKATNEYIPFVYDLVTAPAKIIYSVNQTDGALTQLSQSLPPEAEFTFDPLQPSVGTTMLFDASGSHDDRDSTGSLQARWDFNGDGNWDSGWSTSKAASYSFPERGTFRTVLEIMDSEGQVGTCGHDIYIGSDEELKIVLTWGAYPTDLDSHLYTPAIEGYTYHVYFYNKYQDLTNPPYVMLDLDDRSSYGPETIWFERVLPGTYTYAVHNWSLDGALTTSGATVTVIGRDGVLATLTVPASGIGEWWTVFEMNGETGEITPINVIGSTPQDAGATALALPAKIKKDRG